MAGSLDTIEMPRYQCPVALLHVVVVEIALWPWQAETSYLGNQETQ